MSKLVGHSWGFETSRQELSSRFGLFQIASVKIPTTSLVPGITPTAQPLPQTPAAPITISLNGSGFTVTISSPLLAQPQGQVGNSVLGRQAPLQANPSQAQAEPPQLTLLQAAALGEVIPSTNLTSGLETLFTRSLPANTNHADASTAQQTSPHTPQTTHQAPAHATQTQLSTPHNTFNPNTPAANTNHPQTQQPQASQVTVRKELSLEQSFQLLLRPKNEDVKNSGKNLAGEFHQELSQRAPREIADQLKQQGFQPPAPKVIAEAIQKLVTQLRNDTLIPKDISPNTRVTDILLRVAREIIQPKAQLAARGKDGFITNEKVALYKQTFGPTSRANLLAAGPRLFGQKIPTQNYPQAYSPATTGYQIPTTPYATTPGTAQNSQHTLMTGMPNAQTPLPQAQNPAFYGNPLAPHLTQAAANMQQLHNDPYTTPLQVAQRAQAENDDAVKAQEDPSQNRAFGDSRDGDQSGQGQRNPYQNGQSLEPFMGPDRRLRTLTEKEGIAVLKYFFRISGSLHFLDKIYDLQGLLNSQAGPVNAYIFRAATSQEFYNQCSQLSSGQVMQIMIQDIQNMATQQQPLPTPTSILTNSQAANDAIKPAYQAA